MPSYLQITAGVVLVCIISCPLLLEVRGGESVDGTVIPGFTGVNVVIGVIEKLNASQVFCYSEWYRHNINLVKSFLRQMAYAVSRDGGDNTTGGIWNVSSMNFESTQDYVQNHQDFREKIVNSSLLEVDWINIEYDYLSIPIYSGLAVLLHLDKVLQTDRMPLNMGRLAQIGVVHFGVNPQRWLDARNHLTRHERCRVKSDIVFVIDASHSVACDDLMYVKNMIHNVTSLLVTEEGDNRIGIILVKTEAEVYLPLQDGLLNTTNKEMMLQNIRQIPCVRYEYTNTADGLCKLTNQSWRREDQTVLKMAIVISDGRSNYLSIDCNYGSTEYLARIIHKNYSDILVLAVGVGNNINHRELEMIASGDHLVTQLGQYSEVSSMEYTLRYQVCYTLSESMGVGPGNRVKGSMARGQIMRWILEGVGGDGVTIRLCVRSGRITLYVSHLPHASNATNENQETVENSIGKVTISCSTYFQREGLVSNRNSRKRREVADSVTLYISIEGREDNSTFSLHTANGNFTFDINECNKEPYPCHESATCHNTDGSYYCECKESFIGDGVNCTGTNTTMTNTTMTNTTMTNTTMQPQDTPAMLSTLIAPATLVLTWTMMAAIALVALIVCAYKKISNRWQLNQQDVYYSTVGPPLPPRNLRSLLATNSHVSHREGTDHSIEEITTEMDTNNPGAYSLNQIIYSEIETEENAAYACGEQQDTIISNPAYGTNVSIAPEIETERNEAYEQSQCVHR